MEKIIKTTDKFKAGISEAMNELNRTQKAYEQARANVALYASGYADAMGIDKQKYYLNNEIDFQLFEEDGDTPEETIKKMKALADKPTDTPKAVPKPTPKKNIPVVPPGRRK